MLKHWKRTLSLLAVAAAVALVSAGLALGKKPPKPPPEPPPPPPQPEVEYSITLLGWLDGDVTSVVRDVNNLGEVVGYSKSADGVNRAFSWTEADGMVDLNELMSDEDKTCWELTSAKSINDFGQIAGSGLFNGARRAFRFTPGYTDEDGNEVPPLVENLGTLGGDISYAEAINNLGEVVGVSEDANGEGRAFLYTDEDGDGGEEMVDIGDLGGGNDYIMGGAIAYGINDSGIVTGASVPESTYHSHAFRYTPGIGMEDLTPDLFWKTGSYGRAINDAGDVVGELGVKTGGDYPRHAFLYTDEGGVKDLGTLGGPTSRAWGINADGDIVGSADVSTEVWHGFLYTNKTDTGESAMFKLQDLLVNPEDVQGAIGARKINDFGQICGQADGQAILLTPVEP